MVVIGVVVTLIFVLGNGGGTGSASATADALVTAMNNKDVEAAKKVSCNPDEAGGQEVLDQLKAGGIDFKLSVAEAPKENGDTATGKLKFDITVQGASVSLNTEFTLRKNGGNWCVAEIKEPQMGS